MQNTNIFIETLDGYKREIDFLEINQLRKDILWIYDMNGSEFPNPFVPSYSFPASYWEYLTLSGDKFFYEEDRRFYTEGALIIILCMLIEYIDIPGGDQLIFGTTNFSDILGYVNKYHPSNDDQSYLKELVQLGILIATSIPREDIERHADFEHPKMDRFYRGTLKIDGMFIQPHYRSKLRY